MGRPSRKKVASAIVFEFPDGNTIYFSFNKKGKASLVGNSFSIPQYNVNSSLNLFSDSIDKSSLHISKDSFTNNEKKNIKKEKSSEEHIEMDTFDKFVSCLDYQINLDSILNDIKLSENILPRH